MENPPKGIVWLGDTRDVVREFPSGVRHEVGYALYLGQTAGKHDCAKPLHGFGSGVMEIAIEDRSGAFRTVYTVNIGSSLYVLHAFQKKSKRGIATPKADIDVIRQRLKRAIEVESKRK